MHSWRSRFNYKRPYFLHGIASVSKPIILFCELKDRGEDSWSGAAGIQEHSNTCTCMLDRSTGSCKVQICRASMCMSKATKLTEWRLNQIKKDASTRKLGRAYATQLLIAYTPHVIFCLYT